MRRALFLSALLSLAQPGVTRAATVVLWPVDPVIAVDAQSTAIWIENRGDQPVTMQVRALGWTQAGGDDDYARQDTVVSSPPIARIEPGARQLVRVLRRTPGGDGGESAFRLLIDELPKPFDAAKPGASAALAVQMRYSIPLFTYGNATPAAARLSARFLIEDGRRLVEVRNTGGRHVRLTDLRIVTGGRRDMVVPGLAGYVLAGSVKRFVLPAFAPVGTGVVVGVDGADQTLPSVV